MSDVAAEPELPQQLDGRKHQRPDDRDPHDPPVEEARGRVVDRQDPQRRGIRRQQRAGRERDQADREHRADPGHRGQAHRRMALVEDEERGDRRQREHHDADQVEQQGEQGVADPGPRIRRLRRVDLAAHVAHGPPIELLGQHAHGKDADEAKGDPHQAGRAAPAHQLVGEEDRHARQLRRRGEHRPPALAQRARLLLHAADHRRLGRARRADLAVELRQQQLPHLGIAEPRQEVAQGLAGQGVGQRRGGRARRLVLGERRAHARAERARQQGQEDHDPADQRARATRSLPRHRRPLRRLGWTGSATPLHRRRRGCHR